MDKIRILVADDSALIRHRVKSALSDQSDLEIVAEAGSRRELLLRASATKPQIVILDTALPALGGLEIVRKLREIVPETQIIVLSLHESKQLIGHALELGVRGYVIKSDLKPKLAAAVRAACSGLRFFDRRVLEIILKSYWKGSVTRIEVPIITRRLTAREVEIVRLLVRGYSNREVARNLGISHRTAEVHRARILQKLNLHNLTELIYFAVANQIVQIDLHPAVKESVQYSDAFVPAPQAGLEVFE